MCIYIYAYLCHIVTIYVYILQYIVSFNKMTITQSCQKLENGELQSFKVGLLSVGLSYQNDGGGVKLDFEE